jgi:hypothetical protein
MRQAFFGMAVLMVASCGSPEEVVTEFLPRDVGLDQTYRLVPCGSGGAAGSAACTLSMGSSYSIQQDSGRIVFRRDGTVSWMAGITRTCQTFPGAPSCPVSPGTSLDTTTGTYTISGHTVFVTLPTNRGSGTFSSMAFEGPFPALVPATWAGPDLITWVTGGGTTLTFKP